MTQSQDLISPPAVPTTINLSGLSWQIVGAGVVGDDVGDDVGDMVGDDVGDMVGDDVGDNVGGPHAPQEKGQFAAASGYLLHLQGIGPDPGILNL